MRDRPSPDSITLWALRVLWLAVPFTVGAVFAGALADHSRPVRFVAFALAWAGWAVALLALLVPRIHTLTAVRVLVPAALAAAVWALGAGETGAMAFVALAHAATSTFVALLPIVGDRFVDGSSYGDERRFLLRAPGLLLLGPIPLAWALCLAGIGSGPLLLAARQWVLGAVVSAAGFAVAFLMARSLHALADRWVVLVPAGFVLHDHLALNEPTLFQRARIVEIRPALAGTEATDLSARAVGLALEVRLDQPLPVFASPGRRGGTSEAITLSAFYFTPARAAAVSAEARRRKLVPS